MAIRKRNNNVKRYEVQSRAAVDGLCFGMRPGDESGKVDCWRISDGKLQPVGKSVAWALNDCRFKFAILLIVVSEESNGKQRIVTEYERMAAHYRHSSLVDYLNKQHDAIMDNEKKRGNTAISAGWAACPVPKLDDDLLAEKMLNILVKDNDLIE